MGGMIGGDLGILSPRSNHDRNPRLGQSRNAFLPLRVGQQWPVPHRSAVDDRSHPEIDKLLSFVDQRVKIGTTVLGARGHQRRDTTFEHISQSGHYQTPSHEEYQNMHQTSFSIARNK
jgi:hypothetical protein